MTWRFRFSSRWTSRHSGTGRRAASSPHGGGKSLASRAASSRPSGKGQASPAASARARYSKTVVRPAPTLRAMSRILIPAAFSRRTSVILRMGSFLLGTSVLPRMATCEKSSSKRAACPPWWTKAPPRCAGAQVSGINRNECPLSSGTSVRIP